MNTTTTTNRRGRQVTVTSITAIEPREYRGIEIDRVYKEVRTYNGEAGSSTYYHASNGAQFVPIDSLIYTAMITDK